MSTYLQYIIILENSIKITYCLVPKQDINIIMYSYFFMVKQLQIARLEMI